jgi:hypothetical protein
LEVFEHEGELFNMFFVYVFVFDWLWTDGEKNEHSSARLSAIPEV